MERWGGTIFCNRSAPNPHAKSKGNGIFSQEGHVNAAVRKKSKNIATSKRSHKASLFAFRNNNEPRISTRLFRTNYSDAEWNIRVGPLNRITWPLSKAKPPNGRSLNAHSNPNCSAFAVCIKSPESDLLHRLSP